MRIAIIDDIKTDRDYLFDMIKSGFEDSGFPIHQITGFESGEEFLSSFEPDTYDLIFLDIYMKEINGIETAKQIRSLDAETRLVFISVSNDFASESYAVHADYYLRKPYGKKEFAQLLTRLNLLSLEKRRLFTLPNGLSILLRSILYTSFSGHYVTIYRVSEPVLQIRCTQKEFERRLLPYSGFVLCTKGMIANLNEVSKLNENYFVMTNGDHVPISRRKYPEVKQAYSDFLIEKLRGGTEK